MTKKFKAQPSKAGHVKGKKRSEKNSISSTFSFDIEPSESSSSDDSSFQPLIPDFDPEDLDTPGVVKLALPRHKAKPHDARKLVLPHKRILPHQLDGHEHLIKISRKDLGLDYDHNDQENQISDLESVQSSSSISDHKQPSSFPSSTTSLQQIFQAYNQRENSSSKTDTDTNTSIVKLFSSQSRDLAHEGKALNDLLSSWSYLMELRMKMQPCLETINQTKEASFMSLVHKNSTRNLLKELACPGTDSQSSNLLHLSSYWNKLLEPKHDTLMIRTRQVLEAWHKQQILTSTWKRPASLKAIDQSAWVQVQQAMQDPIRLIKRATAKKGSGDAGVDQSNVEPAQTKNQKSASSNGLSYNDQEFFNVLVKDWAINKSLSSLITTPATFQVQKRKPHKPSKGKILSTEKLHEQLLGLAVAAQSQNWTDERIDQLIGSLFGGNGGGEGELRHA